MLTFSAGAIFGVCIVLTIIEYWGQEND